MAILTDTRHTAEFLVSEANGMYRSREVGTVVGGDDGLEPGTILGRLTAGGNYVRHDAAAATGAEDETAILFEAVPAGETVERTIVVRDCEVNGAHLIYEVGADAAQVTASNTALAALGIIVR